MGKKEICSTAVLASFAVCLLFFGACAKDDEQKSEFRQEFTDEELQSGSASFFVSEDVTFDGVLTPLADYEDGLNSYYLIPVETDVVVSEEGLSESMVLGYSQEEILSLLGEYLGISDVGNAFDNIEGTSGDGFMSVENLSLLGYDDYMILVSMYKGSDSTKTTSSLHVMRDCEEGGPGDYAPTLMRWKIDAKKELPWGSSAEIADKLREMLTTLTQRKICSSYDLLTISADTLLAMQEEGLWELEGMDISSDVKEDSYYYYFYFDIDGFPAKNYGATMMITDGEAYTDGVSAETADDGVILFPRDEWPQEVNVTQEGIIYLDIDSFWAEGDVYRQSLKIVSPSAVLQKINEYYATKLLVEPVVVTEISLVYGSWFTDAADGPIDNAFCPFWEVVVYDATGGGPRVFAYDAVTLETIIYEAYRR